MAATMRAEAVAVEVSSLAGGALNSKCSTNTRLRRRPCSYQVSSCYYASACDLLTTTS